MPWAHITLKCLKPKEWDLEPKILGEHLKAYRLQRQLLKKDVAHLLGVTPWTISNWEKGRTEPPVRALPAILSFLGYDPFPEPRTLPERLLAKRRAMGWSTRQAGRELRIDLGTWRDWERGRVILYRAHRTRMARLLEVPFEELDQEMAARWNRTHKAGPS